MTDIYLHDDFAQDFLVFLVETVEHVVGNVDGGLAVPLGRRELAPEPLEVGKQVGALDELHDDVNVGGGEEAVDEGHDVGVVDLGEHRDFLHDRVLPRHRDVRLLVHFGYLVVPLMATGVPVPMYTAR